ncbi:DUF6207 family protein [Streptomyces sp. NPDC055189]
MRGPKGGLTAPGLAHLTVHAVDAHTATTLASAITAPLSATGPSEPHAVPGERGPAVALHAYTHSTGGPGTAG